MNSWTRGRESPVLSNSVNSMSWLGTAVGAEQKDFFAASSRCQDHPFADAEFHLARGKVGTQDDQSANKIFRLVGAFDTGEDVASPFAAQAERELQQLVGSGDFSGSHDSGDTQVDFDEVVNRTVLCNQRFGSQWFGTIAPR